MAFSTTFATAHNAIERVGADHRCDGSVVTLIVEAGTGVGYIKKVATCPGLIVGVNRASANITFQWRFRDTEWQDFPSSEGVFTVASTVLADIYLVEES